MSASWSWYQHQHHQGINYTHPALWISSVGCTGGSEFLEITASGCSLCFFFFFLGSGLMDDYVLISNPVLSACQLVGASICLPLDENQTIGYEMPLFILVFLILTGVIIADSWLGVLLIRSQQHTGGMWSKYWRVNLSWFLENPSLHQEMSKLFHRTLPEP